jgi:tRNA (adenine57-N1/adenine58-N1)-methyltransferase
MDGGSLNIAQENDRVLLVAPDGKTYMLRLQRGMAFHTNRGIIQHNDLIGQPLGRRVTSHLNQSFVVLRPSIHDVLMRLKRRSQIIYPKEIGQILLKLDARNGRRVIEAGTGSGVLTVALANAVLPDGHVYSYEKREDMLEGAQRNIAQAGFGEAITLVLRDISEGFDEREVDAVFLDVREPWFYLEQVCQALADGGFFGALLPTTNQVSDLLAGMESYPFSAIEVMEILIRRYKPVPGRLRPEDVMVGHTGYLLFARKIEVFGPAMAEAEDLGADTASEDDAPEEADDL